MKFSELTSKSREELNKELMHKRQEFSDMQVKNKLGELKHNHKLSILRKDIAKIMTALNQQIN